MLRRLAPPHLVLAAYCGGLCLALAWRPPLWTALLAAAMAALALAGVVRAPLAWPSGAAWSAAARLGAHRRAAGLRSSASPAWPWREARLTHLSDSRLAALTGRTVDLRAVLTALPTVKDAEVTLAVAVESADGARVAEPAQLRLRLEDGQSFTPDPTGSLTEGALHRRRLGARPASAGAEARAPSTTAATCAGAASTRCWRATSPTCASPATAAASRASSTVCASPPARTSAPASIRR